MEAHARSLTFLEKENKVKIPFFQRAYVWSEPNWEDLLTDLLDFTKNHFLGSLILKQMKKVSGETSQVLVIDGQQRLTTLSILLRALYNSFDAEVQENCTQSLNSFLFYKERATDKKAFIKIEHSKVDKANYSKVIENDIAPSIIDKEKEPSNILRCYRYFTDALSTTPEDDRIELFNKLCDKDNHILVVIDLAENDDEQAIFDTINSAGVRLSGADIVKNALFQRAIDVYGNQEDVEVLYKENWEAIFSGDEQTITYWDTPRQTGRLMRDNIEILLHSIAVIERFFDPEIHTLSDIPNLYKAYFAKLNIDELTKFIKEIAEYARLYRSKVLTFDDNSYQFGYSDFEARLFHILKVCETTTFHPYILSLYRKYESDEQKLKDELAKLEKFIIRRVISGAETKNYNKMCRDFLVDNNKINVSLLEVAESDVKAGLEKISNKIAALVLFWVELYRRDNESKYVDKTELKYAYSLEHIMPQKWEEFWSNIPVISDDGTPFEDTENAKKHRYSQIYAIGNMTLLKSSLNTSLRNYEFKRKVEGDGRKRGIKAYAELGITKFDIVAPYDAGEVVWDETKIKKRTAEITSDVLAIWNIETEQNKNCENLGEE